MFKKILSILAIVLAPIGAFAFETAQGVTATPITTVPFVITASGNYYLPANLTYTGAGAAITVNANEVVIDLNGRSLIAAGGAASPNVGVGILVANHEDVVIQHGDINNFGNFGILLNGSGGRRENNQKNDVYSVNFNGDQIGVGIVSASIDEVEHCNFDGGSIGIEDVASLGGDRFQADNFENQQKVESVAMGVGILTTLGKGVLVEDCLFAIEGTAGIILGSAPDKYRFDSFNSTTVHVTGGTEELAGDL